MSTDQFQFDMAQNSSAQNFLQGVRKAKKSGKGMLSMIWEIAQLRRGQGQIRPDEYFMYGLYDDARYSKETKQSFLSEQGKQLDSPWQAVAKDKPLMTAMLQGLGLPTPETQAIMHSCRTVADAVPLRNRADVCRFLREQASYPIFGKPFDSACSMGTAKIDGYDADRDAVILGDDLIPVEGFAEMVEGLGRAYIFQTLMLPHPEIVKIIGPSVSSVRMFVFSDENGCDVFRAAWKIPASANVADNFWRVGNMLAGIDGETGKIVKTMHRTPTGLEPIDAHPATGVSFTDLVFPHWDEMRATVLAAAVNLPGCHFQGWDVALTDRGPILVELEGDGGNPIMEQLCFESGLLNERYLNIVNAAKDAEKNERKRNIAISNTDLKKNIAGLAIPRIPTDPAQTEAPVEQSV
nr:hypothetical protein [uncultured bacterium]